MTDEELSKMISEFLPHPAEGQHHALKQFAKLVAAAEREACAKVCEEWLHGEWHNQGVIAAMMIRERGAP
jgi:hypothetical protein